MGSNPAIGILALKGNKQKEEILNEGKRFEQDFKSSVPQGAYFLRLADPAAAFSPGDATRFSPHNPYDCVIYRMPNLFTLELKSTKSTSLTYWREGFSSDSYMIKKHQILGLMRAAESKGVVSGLVINFRAAQHTYFWDIEAFKRYTDVLNKKSVNESDVQAGGGILIAQRKLKTNYRYDVEEFMDVTAGRGAERTGRADSAGSRAKDEKAGRAGKRN